MAKFEHQCTKCESVITSDTSEERLRKNIVQHNWHHHSKNSPKRRLATQTKQSKAMKAVWARRKARMGESMLPMVIPEKVQAQLDYQRQGIQSSLSLRDAEAMGQLIQTCVVFYNAIGALAAKLV